MTAYDAGTTELFPSEARPYAVGTNHPNKKPQNVGKANCLPIPEFPGLDHLSLLRDQGRGREGGVVKLKYFAGPGREEIAAVLGCTVHEIRQKWTCARTWLRLSLEK